MALIVKIIDTILPYERVPCAYCTTAFASYFVGVIGAKPDPIELDLCQDCLDENCEVPAATIRLV